ncbi:MAG: hypothetical protein Q9211_005185 [Gyalolechia sp. 1 TL-2023]
MGPPSQPTEPVHNPGQAEASMPPAFDSGSPGSREPLLPLAASIITELKDLVAAIVQARAEQKATVVKDLQAGVQSARDILQDRAQEYEKRLKDLGDGSHDIFETIYDGTAQLADLKKSSDSLKITLQKEKELKESIERERGKIEQETEALAVERATLHERERSLAGDRAYLAQRSLEHDKREANLLRLGRATQESVHRNEMQLATIDNALAAIRPILALIGRPATFESIQSESELIAEVLTEKIRGLEDQATYLKSQLTSKITAADRQQRQQTDIIDRLRVDLDKKNEEFAIRCTELSEPRQRLDLLDNEAREIQRLRTERDDKVRELAARDSDVSKLKDRLALLEREDHKLQSINHDLQIELDERAKKLVEQTTEVSTMTDQIEAERVSVKNLRSIIYELRIANDRQSQELKAQKTEMSALSNRVSLLQIGKDEPEKHNNKTEIKLDTKVQDVTAEGAEISKLKVQLKMQEDEVERLNWLKDKLESNSNKKQHEAASQNSEIARLSNLNGRLEGEKDSHKSRAESLESKLHVFQAQKSEAAWTSETRLLQDAVKHKQEHIARLEATLASFDVAELQGKTEQLDRELKATTRELEQKSESYRVLSSQNEVKHQFFKALENRVRSWHARLSLSTNNDMERDQVVKSVEDHVKSEIIILDGLYKHLHPDGPNVPSLQMLKAIESTVLARSALHRNMEQSLRVAYDLIASDPNVRSSCEGMASAITSKVKSTMSSLVDASRKLSDINLAYEKIERRLSESRGQRNVSGLAPRTRIGQPLTAEEAQVVRNSSHPPEAGLAVHSNQCGNLGGGLALLAKELRRSQDLGKDVIFAADLAKSNQLSLEADGSRMRKEISTYQERLRRLEPEQRGFPKVPFAYVDYSMLKSHRQEPQSICMRTPGQTSKDSGALSRCKQKGRIESLEADVAALESSIAPRDERSLTSTRRANRIDDGIQQQLAQAANNTDDALEEARTFRNRTIELERQLIAAKDKLKSQEATSQAEAAGLHGRIDYMVRRHSEANRERRGTSILDEIDVESILSGAYRGRNEASAEAMTLQGPGNELERQLSVGSFPLRDVPSDGDDGNSRKRRRTAAWRAPSEHSQGGQTYSTAATQPCNRLQWDLEDVKREGFVCSLVPSSIVQDVQRQIKRWIDLRYDFADGATKGKAKCAETFAVHGRAVLENVDEACSDCTKRGLVCVKLKNGKLEPLPLPLAARGSNSPNSVGYWKTRI